MRRKVSFFFLFSFWFLVANFRILASFFSSQNSPKNCFLERGFLNRHLSEKIEFCFARFIPGCPTFFLKIGKWAVF